MTPTLSRIVQHSPSATQFTIRASGPRFQVVNVDIPGNKAPIWGQLEADCRPTHPEIGSDKSRSTETTEAALSQQCFARNDKAADPDLPSAQNSRRSALNQSLSSFMDRAQTKLFAASQRINDLTGYSSIESLKAQISALETQLQTAQSHLTSARTAYKTAVSDRSTTQREVTTLLARQKTWTPADFERFTTLYRQDYELEASGATRSAA
ncbi:hypothetical protein ONZ43_g7777 [Nemania bipapillata]|uniref:Uncharacterized protein n=1 Tax=Nemania bipapillata TaxID=110536 RepID=A0ACC2HP14_9PEZI|nr:hypothetical protein ONZ43_g7777 [Nemania bipapillata]